MLYEPKYDLNLDTRFNKIIKVLGVGGAGCNAMLYMHNQGMRDVDFVACNTDAQVLDHFPDDIVKIQLGANLTKGLGAGTNWEIGRDAAIESEEAIREVLADPTEMVFITAGMGGGTGTGAAPEIARVAKELGRLTIAVVTFPFGFEGKNKLKQASDGVEKLQKYCDTVLVIKNEKLAEMYADLDIEDAYKKADEVLARGVRSIAELITRPGIINLDFADVRMVLSDAGHAVMGTAEASGPERAFHAIEDALNSPLLENNNIRGAKRVLVSMAYSDEKPEYKIKMADQTQIMNFVETKIKSQAEVFKHGYAIDRTLGDKIRVTIVAAQFSEIETFDHDSESDVKEELIPSDPIEPQVSVGKGIEVLIPPKPAKGKKPNIGQPSLFESDHKLDNLFDDFLKGDIDYKVLIANPTYERLGARLYDQKEIEVLNPEKYPLQVAYEALLKEKIIR